MTLQQLQEAINNGSYTLKSGVGPGLAGFGDGSNTFAYYPTTVPGQMPGYINPGYVVQQTMTPGADEFTAPTYGPISQMREILPWNEFAGDPNWSASGHFGEFLGMMALGAGGLGSMGYGINGLGGATGLGGVGSINPSLASSFAEMYSPAAWSAPAGAAAGSTGGSMLDLSSIFPDFTNYSGQMSQIPGLEQSLSGVPLNLSAGSGLTANSWINNLMQQAANDPLGTAGQAYKALQSSGMLSGGLTALGGYLQGTAGQDAATKAAAAQIQAAQIAADAAKFRPVGVTTRFGKSDFTKDAQGNVIGAGYALTPDVKAQQDQLMAASGGMLNQFTGSQAATAPMGQAAQTMMALGNNYLATTPEQQAQKYMAEQQALLATGRERDTNQMLTGEFNRGTYGLSTGGTSTGMMGANPRLEALYNAQRQQDLGLAAHATQGGMDYAKFGAGMVGSGGDLLKSMYGTQTASYDPYKTAMGGAQTLEGLGQNAMDLGVNLGKVTSNAQSGQLLGQGMLNASQTMQPANAYSPWGAMLTGAGNTMQNYGQQQQQQQYQFNPFTGVRL